MNKEVYLAKETLAELKSELKEMTTVKRPHIIMRIQEALSMGDLSENAEYHAAREEQAFLEGRIEEIEYMVKNAKIITEGHSSTGMIGLGNTIVCQVNDEDKVTYTIVGSAEADPTNGKLSNESPIGKALMNKKKGDVVDILIPAGTVKYKILEVK